MTLDEQDLRRGLKFIVGTWRPDYIVNAFSNDLAHIPASEFKSDDGRDFTALSFEFFEDHSVIMRDSGSGKEERGTWEQTDRAEYHYTLGAFMDIPEGDFRKSAETLSQRDENLVFGLGFLAVALKKTADGVVTEPKDVGDIEPDESDKALDGIVGVYEIAEAMTMVGGDFGLFGREAVEADLKARGADEDEANEALGVFAGRVEFTADHKVVQWMKLPAGVSEEEIKAALEAGEISGYKDGMFTAGGEKEWKAVDGRYYYNTGEHRELFGEEQSPWDELAFDENGLLPFGDGMMKLRRI
ncbi:MAG: hypothetical protein IJL83_02590 [Clostridia bacterium]|nr:hypothetical protein [Clostridia bacterium]